MELPGDTPKMHASTSPSSRRAAIETLASAAGLFLVGCAANGAVATPHVAGDPPEGGSSAGSSPRQSDASEEAEVTPGEDLMQEHGVIERLLLIYDEVAGRLERGERADLTLIGNAAGIIKTFVESYHEKLEEAFVFPRLESAGQQATLVSTLRTQHDKGREVTAEIERRSQGPADATLARLLRGFSRMYRPHAAWEDTVVFPAFRKVIGRDAYRELGEKFEEEEHQRFGEHGFDAVVTQLLGIEQALGIGDLSAYTPK
jgi:hemerythrin-like domain-containing protein